MRNKYIPAIAIAQLITYIVALVLCEDIAPYTYIIIPLPIFLTLLDYVVVRFTGALRLTDTITIVLMFISFFIFFTRDELGPYIYIDGFFIFTFLVLITAIVLTFVLRKKLPIISLTYAAVISPLLGMIMFINGTTGFVIALVLLLLPFIVGVFYRIATMKPGDGLTESMTKRKKHKQLINSIKNK